MIFEPILTQLNKQVCGTEIGVLQLTQMCYAQEWYGNLKIPKPYWE
jgi:hypothetical protein